MATHETEIRNGQKRTMIKLEPGERIALCRCFNSKNFPFCDGTHKEYPNQDRGPVIVEAPAPPPEERVD